jgi:hypothetical protein
VSPAPRRRRPTRALVLFEESGATMLDLVDNILNKGLTVTGDVVLSLADVDLVYVKLSALLCAADKVLPGMRPRQPESGALPTHRRK